MGTTASFDYVYLCFLKLRQRWHFQSNEQTKRLQVTARCPALSQLNFSWNLSEVKRREDRLEFCTVTYYSQSAGINNTSFGFSKNRDKTLQGLITIRVHSSIIQTIRHTKYVLKHILIQLQGGFFSGTSFSSDLVYLCVNKVRQWRYLWSNEQTKRRLICQVTARCPALSQMNFSWNLSEVKGRADRLEFCTLTYFSQSAGLNNTSFGFSKNRDTRLQGLITIRLHRSIIQTIRHTK